MDSSIRNPQTQSRVPDPIIAAHGSRCRQGLARVDRRVGAVPRAARVSDERTLLPGQPHDDDGPLFREPWEAQAFAMTLALHEHGLFTWAE